MASKYFKAFNFLKKKGTASPTITQPRQLKTTMKKIRSQYERFGFKDAKTAKDRANIVRNKKSIERMDKLDKAKAKVKTGEKGKKEIQKMVDTKQATKVGGQVFHKSVREKKMFGGRAGKPATKQMKGDSKEQKKKPPFDKEDKPATIREKRAPKKKMDRLKQLREELK
jgi:hypothetical protein